MPPLNRLFRKERRRKERRKSERRKELSEQDFRELIESDDPDRRRYRERRVNPRRRSDQKRG
jgi:hypothetical protein